MRTFLKIVLAVVIVYFGLTGALLLAMRQPPAVFGRIMARMPGPAFLVLPFRPLWMFARAGRLQPGDAAPDFWLPTQDGASRVSLSAFRGRMPVVLVFGSYT